MKIDRQTLSLFCYSMAQCAGAGVPPERALQLAGGGLRNRILRRTIQAARRACGQGASIADSLAPHRAAFPHHFLPVIVAGETSGRLMEAFEFLHAHAVRLAPSLALVRNTWLYPLICIVFGWLLRAGIYVHYERYQAAVWFVWSTFGQTLLAVAAGWAILRLRPFKRLIDSLLLHLPIIRETLIHMSLVVFFATFRLVYEVGNTSVLTMFDLALQTVGNSRIREAFLPARRVLEQQGAFADAFAQVSLLGPNAKSALSNGAVSGQLEQSLAAIIKSETEELEIVLRSFNAIFQRLVAFSVSMSVVETILICIL